MLARVTTGRCSPRDLSFIARTLTALPQIKLRLADCNSNLLRQLEGEIDVCEDVRQQLTSALIDDCPLSARDGTFPRSATAT